MTTMTIENAYVLARTQPDALDSQKEEYYTMIDHRPYYPFLEVQGNDHSSIRHAVARILFPKKDTEPSESTAPTDTEISMWPVSMVSGGNTNQLFCVKTSDNTQNNDNNNHTIILVRIFGAEGMIDRDVENATFAALAEQGVAPKYYGRFANGRLEEWLEGMKPLSTRDLAIPTISKQIARQMRQVHARFQLPDSLQKDHNVEEPSLWKQLHDWMNQAGGTSLTSFHNNTDGDAKYKTSSAVFIVSSLLEKLPMELTWLQESVVPKDAKVAFCHNDVLASNVMYNHDTESIRLIDFEYGGMNYIAFDIANHFNEFAGGTEENGVTNYDWFPTKDQQMVFLKSYLDAAASEKQIEAFYQEVQTFVLADHLYWGLWAVNSAASEGCASFDYLLYAQNRFGQYFATKKGSNRAL